MASKPSPKRKRSRLRKADPKDYAKDSFLIHGHQWTHHWDFSHHVVPPQSLSSTYRLSSAERGEAGFCGYADPAATKYTKPHIYIYDRLDEPNRAMLEDRLAAAEGGEAAVCFATGMAAISAAIMHRLKAGDEVVAHPTLYGCTYSLLANWLPRYNIKVRYHDLANNPSKLRIGKRTRVVYCESPSNPTLQIIDIERIAERVAKANQGRAPEEHVQLIVDNTFATPACQRPIDLGADVVASSLTKGICGFGTDMGGVVVCPESDEGSLLMYRKDFGGPLSATPAWRILTHGLPTLSLRTRRQEATAWGIAEWLEQHPKVARVQYPGLPSSQGYEIARRQMHDFDGNFAPGTLLYFEVKGSSKKAKSAAADRVVDWIADNGYAITLAVSLGQVRTLIERPGGMTHSMLPPEVAKVCGIGAGGIRLACGIEEPEDLRRDLERALDQI